MIERAWEEFRLAFCPEMTGKVLESRKKFFYAGVLAMGSMAIKGMEEYGPKGMAENVSRCGREAQYWMNQQREPEAINPEVLPAVRPS